MSFMLLLLLLLLLLPYLRHVAWPVSQVVSRHGEGHSLPPQAGMCWPSLQPWPLPPGHQLCWEGDPAEYIWLLQVKAGAGLAAAGCCWAAAVSEHSIQKAQKDIESSCACLLVAIHSGSSNGPRWQCLVARTHQLQWLLSQLRHCSIAAAAAAAAAALSAVSIRKGLVTRAQWSSPL